MITMVFSYLLIFLPSSAPLAGAFTIKKTSARNCLSGGSAERVFRAVFFIVNGFYASGRAQGPFLHTFLDLEKSMPAEHDNVSK